MGGSADARTVQLQAAATQAIQAVAKSPERDLYNERSRASFSSKNLVQHLFGEEHLRRQAKVLRALETQAWAQKDNFYYLTRTEWYLKGLEANLGSHSLMDKFGFDEEDLLLAFCYVDVPGGLYLHYGMFIPTIVSQANDEQLQRWLEPAKQLKMIGTYAQTEIGHGTFLRGLETTATFDRERDEFIIHSPTLTATKWWPGGLGKTATHVVLMARLFIDGRDYGPHAFMVQVRSLADHQPMPGVEVGAIGPKFGYNSVDNGFLRFDHVRIPRSDMFMKYAKNIIKESFPYLARAVTISVRYNLMRRQTAVEMGMPETTIMDYANSQRKLLPLIGACFVNLACGKHINSMYVQFVEDSKKRKFDILPDLHLTSSILKALCTNFTAEGIESCRRSCGGHGYSVFSALPQAYANYVQNCTWEGDNDVLCLQTARGLLKALMGLYMGKATVASIPQSMGYFSRLATFQDEKCGVSAPSEWCIDQSEELLRAFEHRAMRSTVLAAKGMMERFGNIVFQGDAWNESAVDLIRAAKAHGQVIMLRWTTQDIAKMASQGLPSSCLRALNLVVSLWALCHLDDQAGSFMEDEYLSGTQLAAARTQIRTLLKDVRPEAAALVDSFNLPDYFLNSCIGRSDGKIYEAVLDAAKREPLNRTEEGPGYRPYLAKYLRSAKL